ncbi:MAG: patatin-like phospholipase family protein [Candidatus Pacearchaeota archaeon]|nr:patatin-like phospholipase family protein [Candidatus Pacearchaeota archaeon]
MVEEKKEIKKGAKKKVKENLALVLSGGGARGMAHIGVLKVLGKNNIVPNVIIGTSAGSMVGGMYAAGKLAEFEKMLTSKNQREIKKIAAFRPHEGGLINPDRFEKEIRKLIGNKKIEELDKRYFSTAVDLLSGKEVWIDKGDLCQAILASSSIPLLLPPVKKDGMLLVDGGLQNPLAVDAGFKLANKVIAISIERSLEKMPKKEKYGFSDIAERALTILQGEIVENALKKHKKNLVIIRIEVNMDTVDFHKAKEAIEIGEKETEKHIEEIKKLVLAE